MTKPKGEREPDTRSTGAGGEIVDHYCGDEMGRDGKCTVCGGPDPR